MPKTKPLALLPVFETGNTKAAAAQAGATSADLWMTPYESLRYDPRDNVRPVDPQWIKDLTALMIHNGYDKGSPLHCYARKVDGKDYFYVYKGQHRYLAAGAAIKAGKDLGKIPIVVRDSREVKRSEMVIDGYVSNVSKPASPLDLAMSIAELRDVHGMDTKAICTRLNISEQSIRDAALLENAPTELHALVRDGSIAGTLAIEEIRAHGGDKALERIVSGLSKAKEAGKSKVTKKHLIAGVKADPKPAVAPSKINDARAKQLLQALQSVLHDPAFDHLSPGTMHAVHTGLHGMADMLDAVGPLPANHPIHVPNKHGVFDACETIKAPVSKRNKKSPASIHLAHIEEGAWIHSFTLEVGSGGMSGLPSMHSFTVVYPTRGQAIRGAVSDMTRVMQSPSYAKAKEAPIVNAWLDKLYAMPDPDWTPELAAKHAASLEAAK
ncbi:MULTISPECIES: pyridoxal phosphate biosynthetic protein PdxJ [unclassified Burkholderia]|uniref:pyridoxal phosphate biosynthetic protein PdxJ n=1 Tax=unclassified Burkholderia TaxID=2613784 RepID=UPI000F561ACB|nr:MULTISPECIES: pyridoxal phosphate biosynthetic protein PdxJ [unclassified Burkholderia]RQR81469.1 pyridoxal phosphate biosynthetic protein PdxJ [Burkholderia sp. Bp9011]RQR91046.1 pyridoxal phosphate biosynthetic protein PdxJ [Burkholderia sp. Bp9010]RQS75193.1 pyridoxal phosphate biosynthetic protein PdxJ [Burkholderia sp. Bp8977]